MKVVILCGGLGTRLREETEFRPKLQVEVGGKPSLWHIMKTYADHCFREFVLCLGQSSQIRYHGRHPEQGFGVTLAGTGVDCYVEDGAAAYMLLAEQLHCRPELRGMAFNFSNESEVTVSSLVQRIQRVIRAASNEIRRQCLNAQRARRMLHRSPLFTRDEGLDRTVSWYREFVA